jgi:DNA-directed RNA polymerase specialized sigma24 family protein
MPETTRKSQVTFSPENLQVKGSRPALLGKLGQIQPSCPVFSSGRSEEVVEVRDLPERISELSQLKNTGLVRLCATHPENGAAWDEFYLRFHRSIKVAVERECSIKRLPQRIPNFNDTLHDLVQEAYVKLIEKDFQALKKFNGKVENSIFLYLSTLARNVVRNYLAAVSAQKRACTEVSLDAPAARHGEPETTPLQETLSSISEDLEGYLKERILREEMDKILQESSTRRNRTRDIVIMKLALDDGFSAIEIRARYQTNLSAKGVANVISRLKQVLRSNLPET